MRAKPKQAKERHAHWKSLIGTLEKRPKIAEVYLILIRPIEPPEPARRHPGLSYDRIAYVHGKGSEYSGEFKHLTNCTWESMD
jgi:hypothetical protein